MNLEGGHSVDLADQGQILLPPGRNLTNVLVIYDRDYPPPDQLKQSWERFQNRRAFLIKLDITIIWNKLLQAKIMTATKAKIWTVEEYHRMIEAGILNENDNIGF
jgi:hypothetical protein